MLIIAVAAAAPLAAPYRACAALPFFDSDTEQSLFDRAKKASDDGFYDVSIRQFNRFLKKYAQSPLAGDALLLLSHAYLSSARYGEAMDCSRKLIDGDGPLKEKGMLILADALFRKGDYDAALSACAEAVAAFPDGAQKELILLIEGKCRYAQRRYDAALESFGAIARRQEPAKDPVMIDARIEMVKSYCCLGDYAAAEESAKALRQLPLTVRQRAEAGYWNGLLMSVTERHAEAAKAFEEILSLKQSATDVPDVLYRLGLSYARSGKYDAADGAFERVTAEYPKSRYYLPALIQRARVRILAGKYDDALQFIEKNLAKKRGEPYDGVAALLAAMAHQSRRDNAQAEKYFKRALKLSSDPGVRSQAFAGLGETLFGGNDFAGAIAQFAAASAVEPDPLRQIVIRSRIADAHLALRQYREALDTLVALLGERAADITESQKAGLLLNAGIASSELGDHAAAAAYFLRVREECPGSPSTGEAVYREGEALYDAEKYQEAIGSFAILNEAKADPVWKEKALFKTAQAYMRMNRAADAASFYERTAGSAGDEQLRRIALFELGWARAGEGKEDEALAIFEKYIKTYPTSAETPEACFWIGGHYFALNDFEEAHVRFERLIKDYPSCDLADDALFWAALCAGREGNWLEAIWYLKRVPVEYPKSALIPDAVYCAGDALAAVKRYRAALKYFGKVVHEYPAAVIAYEAYGRIGDMQAALGEYGDARASYEKAMGSDDLSLRAQALFKSGMCLDLSHDRPQAQEAFLKVLYDYPDEQYWFSQAAFRAAGIYEDAGDWMSAVTIYRKVISRKADRYQHAREREEIILREHPGVDNQ